MVKRHEKRGWYCILIVGVGSSHNKKTACDHTVPIAPSQTSISPCQQFTHILGVQGDKEGDEKDKLNQMWVDQTH